MEIFVLILIIIGCILCHKLSTSYNERMPKRKPKNLSDILEKAVEEWGENNAPIIFKTEEYVQAQNSSSTQGFRLLQDPKGDYITLVNKNLTRNSEEWSKYAKYSKGNHLTGKFLDMPDYATMTTGAFEMTLEKAVKGMRKTVSARKLMMDVDGYIIDINKAEDIFAYEN